MPHGPEASTHRCLRANERPMGSGLSTRTIERLKSLRHSGSRI